MSARNDGDLVQRVCIFGQHLHDGMTSLVVGGSNALLLFNLPALLGATPAHLVAGLFEVHHLNDIFVCHGGNDGCFVDQCRQICAAEAWCGACNLVQVDIWSKLYLLGMDAKDLPPTHYIRRADANHAVKSTRARQGRVKHIGSIGCSNDDDLIGGLEAIHLNQDGVEGLLAFIMTTGRESTAAASANGIDFIQEDDAGRILFRLLEQIAHAACTDANEHFYEI